MGRKEPGPTPGKNGQEKLLCTALESNPKNQENHGGKRAWSNPGKTGQEELIGSRNLLPSTTTGARGLNKSHVRSMRPYMAYEDNRRVPFLLFGFLINEVPFF